MKKRPKGTPITKELIVSRCKTDPISGCWIWQGSRHEFGYGTMSERNKPVKVHQRIYELCVGPRNGLCVLHRCDNPPCCNPDHLFLGTRLDNVRDCISKGRFPVGHRNAMSKLSPSNVAKIRNSNLPELTLAKRFGVNRSIINRVRNRKTYRELP